MEVKNKTRPGLYTNIDIRKFRSRLRYILAETHVRNSRVASPVYRSLCEALYALPRLLQSPTG